MIHHIALNSWDELYNIISNIIKGGGEIFDISYGQFGLILLGILLPAATLLFLVSASTALTRNRTARVVAIITLGFGCLLLLTFLIMATCAIIFGSSWAHTPYQ